MNKYTLNVCEIVIKSHEVTIETDKDIDAVCNEIEDRIYGINNIWDIQYINGVEIIKIIEDEDGSSEFEVEGIYDDKSFYDEVIE